jgi:hypothetical protein
MAGSDTINALIDNLRFSFLEIILSGLNNLTSRIILKKDSYPEPGTSSMSEKTTMTKSIICQESFK